ncbi:hypothetical protein [Micromonospora halophytica]|uniref:Uncharacterized protein n=1 Tax=Micromonospora halophytica TaxID=47864 RepID=A0A1C5HB27_9ACTN|nr:hypothetical protein [Micromonospora halophytica]SCG42671.1 hypothetical protein GA0070560_103330 [Micromonospora halophytica]
MVQNEHCGGLKCKIAGVGGVAAAKDEIREPGKNLGRRKVVELFR